MKSVDPASPISFIDTVLADGKWDGYKLIRYWHGAFSSSTSHSILVTYSAFENNCGVVLIPYSKFGYSFGTAYTEFWMPNRFLTSSAFFACLPELT